MYKMTKIIALLTCVFFISVSAAAAVELTASDVANAKGDGPDGKGNTDDDTWGFWFELVHGKGVFHRLSLATADMSPQQKQSGIPRKVTGPIGGFLPNPKDTEGWIFGTDWDGRYEGVWGDKKTNQVLLHPYVEKNAHGALAITYRVPAAGAYKVSAKITDLNVGGAGGKNNGVSWHIEVADGGERAAAVKKGGPVGDKVGPVSAEFSADEVRAEKGQLIRLAINPNGWWGGDMTRIDYFRIAPAEAAESQPASESDRKGVRVAAYNVQYGKWCKPEQVGELLKPHNFDVVAFGEVPAGDWTARVGKALGMEHCYVGKHTPYNYKDKYKSILSRTPLTDQKEHHLGHGWSTVVAKTTVRGISLTVYSLHIGGTEKEGCQRQLAQNVLPKDDSENIVMMGDFNACVDKDRRKRKRGPMTWLLKYGMRPTWTDLKVDLSKMFSYALGYEYSDQRNIDSYGVIDHILIGPKSKLVAVEGGLIEEKGKPLSDHKPVWAELRPKQP